MNLVKQGDARNLSRLRTYSFQCVVTSPPYYRQRKYGTHEGEIGAGTLDEYVADMVKVGAEMWRLLDESGVWWLNLGDKAAGSGGAGGDHNAGGSHDHIPKYGATTKKHTGLRDGQWCDVPGRVVHALQDDGWLLKASIIWDKGKVRRGDRDLRHTHRPGVQTEMIYMLTKHRKHRFYPQPNMEIGNIWRFPSNTEAKASYAPFPDELPRRCILLSTQPGHRVLDPFAGSGTTVQVANELHRRGVGYDLYAV